MQRHCIHAIDNTHVFRCLCNLTLRYSGNQIRFSLVCVCTLFQSQVHGKKVKIHALRIRMWVLPHYTQTKIFVSCQFDTRWVTGGHFNCQTSCWNHVCCVHHDFVHRVVHLACLHTSWPWRMSVNHHMIGSPPLTVAFDLMSLHELVRRSNMQVCHRCSILVRLLASEKYINSIFCAIIGSCCS